VEPKYPPDAYRGFRAALPDWFIGLPSAADQERVVRLLGLRPGDCVCDAACGPGFNIARLAQAVGSDGLVIAVEDSPHLLARAEHKVKHDGWANVRLLSDIDPEQFPKKPVDAVVVSYNPPIVLQRPDLLAAAWQILKPGGRMALVAGRCTTLIGRLLGTPFVKVGLNLAGHSRDWHYWTVHEPWKHLEELSGGNLWVEPRRGFQYLLWAEKPK